MTGVESDRVFRFRADRSTVWDAIARVDEYQRWWPWLRRCDARGVLPGARWTCTIRPPLPYELNLTVHLTHVETRCRIDATVSGDIEGSATVTLRDIEPDDDRQVRARRGTEVRLVSTLGPRAGPLVAVTRLMPAVARWGHDWVLDSGYRRFRAAAL